MGVVEIVKTLPFIYNILFVDLLFSPFLSLHYYKFKNPIVKKVIVEFAPVSERYWRKGDEATIYNNQIRLGGCWFDFDERYIVEFCN